MKDYCNGPVEDEKRSCTDLFCFIIFIIFIAAMLIIGIYSWTSGNFSKLTTPYDPDGKGCGVDHPDHPFIYFASPHVGSLWKTVCLKQCPEDQNSNLDCAKNSEIKCSGDVEIYASTGFQGRVCLPTSDHLKQEISSALGAEGVDQKIAALQKSWVIILVSIPIAIVLSIVFMLIMRLLAGVFVYLLVFIAILGLILFGVFLIMPHESSNFIIKESRTAAIILGVISIVIGLLILIAFCCFRKRIKLASIVVKVSARFVNENCAILILPLILFVVMVVFVILWIFEALGYYSMGTPIHEKQQLPFQHFQTSGSIKALGLAHVFQLLWVLFFLVETGDFIVAGATCSWYFQRQSPYSESSERYRKFHIGSVALGSFFLALIGFIKFLYELLTPQQAEEEGCLSSWKKFCGCCCFLCVNYLFNCFNSGAYTLIHLTGDSYCTSAWDAISLKIKEPVTSAVVAFMGVLFSVLVRIGITAATCAICYIILKSAEPYNIDVPDVTAPMIVIGLIAFTISSFFVSLYSEAMEAVYVCYIADKQAGGSDDKAPEELKQFLEEAKRDNHFVE